jgi:FixJ family two-component response regulator
VRKGKVFLVDDDASVRKALQRLMRAGGYQVELFADAAAYLHHERPVAPACLLLDIRMPGMSGLELQRSISGTDWALPIVFITGHGDTDTRREAVTAGAVDVLEKPVDEAILFRALDRALARSRANGDLAGPTLSAGRVRSSRRP